MKTTISNKHLIGLLIFVFLLVLQPQPTQAAPSSTTKGRVIQLSPDSIEYLANTFDQILLLILQKQDDQIQTVFEQYVKKINVTYPNDHTLYGVTYLEKDKNNKLADKYGFGVSNDETQPSSTSTSSQSQQQSGENTKKDATISQCFKIITRRNHYGLDLISKQSQQAQLQQLRDRLQRQANGQQDFSQPPPSSDPKSKKLRSFQKLERFYSSHVHPVLQLFVPQQFNSINTEYFLTLQYTSFERLESYIKNIYSKIYDVLRLFGVKAVAVDISLTEHQKELSEKYKYQGNYQDYKDYKEEIPPQSQPIDRIRLFKKSLSLIKPVATYANELNNTDQIIDFVNVETLPLLTNLDQMNYVRIFGSFLDTQLLLIYDEKDKHDSDIKAVRKELIKAAFFNKNQELKYQRVLFAEATTQFLSKYFDQSIKDLTDQKTGQVQKYKVLITKTDFGQFQIRKFLFQDYPISSTKITQFIQDVRMKRIDAQYDSEPIPSQEQQSKSILKKIVGKTFIQEIYQNSTDLSIAVLFVDSKDPESYKDLKQAFENFTLTYQEILKGKLVSAMFDLAKNEHKLLTIKTAPQIVLFEKTNKKKPSFFRGYAKTSSIKDWINYQAKDFTIPDNFGEEILPLGGPSSSQVPVTAKELNIQTQKQKQNVENQL